MKVNSMFDPTTVADTSFAPLPKGKYNASISDVELKVTKSGTGKFFLIEFSIIDHEFKGRKVKGNYNIVNPNETAQNIGRSQLKELCQCVNVPFDRSFDTDNLLGKVLMIAVKTENVEGKEYAKVEYVGQTTLNQKSVGAAKPAVSNNPFSMDDEIPF